MFQTRILILFTIIALFAAQAARGEAFSASVEIAAGDHKASSTSESAQRKDKPLNSRPRLEASAEGKIVIRWKVTRNTGEPLKDVLVHFYVVQIERPGQAPPALDPRVVQLESALTMDFENKTSASAEMSFRPPKPGTYLLRIEADGGSQQTFAELDLIAK
jgi:hypothetical protein